jgi:hypothetical protein
MSAEVRERERQGGGGGEARAWPEEPTGGEVRDFLLEARRRLEARFQGTNSYSAPDGSSSTEAPGGRGRREWYAGGRMDESRSGSSPPHEYGDNRI